MRLISATKTSEDPVILEITCEMSGLFRKYKITREVFVSYRVDSDLEFWRFLATNESTNFDSMLTVLNKKLKIGETYTLK